MKAVVIKQAGPPEVLVIKNYPTPEPLTGQVLIEVKAFGLNRYELYARNGKASTMEFPTVPGIECVGVVREAPGGEFQAGDIVTTALGGMGREFDGSYAEFVCVPCGQVMKIKTTLDWVTLASLPLMVQTAWGALHNSLCIQSGQTLLIRGGTTSIGMAALVLAKEHGLSVVATTRNFDRKKILREYGADYVFIDTGKIADEVWKIFPSGINHVLELVGTKTLLDSLRCVAGIYGTVCMAGAVSNHRKMDNFYPMEDIPSTVRLTSYLGKVRDFIRTPLQEIICDVENGHTKFRIDRVFKFGEIVEAHRYMEENRAVGKLVVEI